jgi:high-affinity iron transporter
LPLPGWTGVWFAALPHVEGLAAQGIAALFVIGSYLVVERKKRPRRQMAETTNI